MTGDAVTLIAMALGVSAAALPLAVDVSPLFIWNASASVPIGLYAVRPANQLQINDLVVVRPPEDGLRSLPKAATCRAACRS